MATCYNSNRKLVQDRESSQKEVWQPWCHGSWSNVLYFTGIIASYTYNSDKWRYIYIYIYEIGEDIATMTKWEVTELCPSIKAENKLVNLSGSTYEECQNLIRSVQKPRNADE